jgi:hypothetical protein
MNVSAQELYQVEGGDVCDALYQAVFDAIDDGRIDNALDLLDLYFDLCI